MMKGCLLYAASMNYLRIANFIRMATDALVSVFMALVVLKMFPSSMAVISGLNSASKVVKEALPNAAVPGYMLLTGVVAFLPPFLWVTSTFSQLAGEPLITFALMMI